MEYLESSPSAKTAVYIKRFWSLRSSDRPETETVLPDGCPEIVFNLSDRFQRLVSDQAETQAATLFSGQLTRSISIRPTGSISLFGVRFRPAGAYAIADMPMTELTDQIVDIGTVLGRNGSELEERINLAGSFEERIAIFEKFFLSRMNFARTNELPLVASELIARAGGSLGLADLRDRFGVTERTIERLFNRCVGVSPKLLSRLSRFQAVIKDIQGAESADILDAALSFGYCDQSHLIREFRDFAGETPRAFFNRTHKLSDAFTAGV